MLIFISQFLCGSTKNEADAGSITQFAAFWVCVCVYRIKKSNVNQMNRSIFLCHAFPKIENKFDNKFLKAILRVLIIWVFILFLSIWTVLYLFHSLMAKMLCCRWCSSLIFYIVRSLIFVSFSCCCCRFDHICQLDFFFLSSLTLEWNSMSMV